MSLIEQGPFDGILTNFLEDLQRRCQDNGRPKFARSTALAYRGDARGFCLFLEGKGMADLSAITQDQITNYGQNLADTSATATQVRKMAGLKTFLKWTAQTGLTGQELADQVCYPSHYGVYSQPFLTIKAMEGIILAAVRSRQIPRNLAFRDPALIAILSSGATVTEALNLDVKDVTPEEDHILINVLGVRSGNVRTIKLDPFSSAMMALHAEQSFLDPSQPVFTSVKGGRLSRQGCNLMLKETSERFDIKPPITPTRLRRASVLRDRGNVSGIKKRLDVSPDLASSIAKHANDLKPSAFGSYLEVPQDFSQGDYLAITY